MKVKAQETIEKFQQELNKSRKASADFFVSKKGTVNPFFTNVATSIKAIPITSENFIQTMNDTTEEVLIHIFIFHF